MYIHTYIPTYMHEMIGWKDDFASHIHTHMFTHAHMQIETDIRVTSRLCAYGSCVCTHYIYHTQAVGIMYECVYIYTRTQTHTHVYAHTHTHKAY